jgi:predicted ester cyclase
MRVDGAARTGSAGEEVEMRVPYDPGERVPARSDPEVVREYLHGASGDDLSVLRRLVADESLRLLDAELRTTFPDLAYALEDISEDGDTVVADLTVTGTHQGVFHGVEATGACVSVRGKGAFRIEEGKIVEGRIDLDEGEILHQIASQGTGN